MECREVKRNLSAYHDGELNRDMAAKLQTHLQTCPSCSAELHFIERLSAASVKAFSQTPFNNSLVERTFTGIKERPAAARRYFTFNRALVAAASFVAAVAIVLLASYYIGDTGRNPAALAVGTCESAFIRRTGSSAWRKLGLDDRLYGGDVVKNASAGLVSLSTPRGSKLVLNHDTCVQMGADPSTASFELIRGELFAEVNREPFRIFCDGATVSVDGTSFSVRREADRAFVTVVEGTVRYASASSEVKVTASQQSVVVAGCPPSQPVKVDFIKAIGWLRGAPAASAVPAVITPPAVVSPGQTVPVLPGPNLPLDRPLTPPKKKDR